MSDALNSLVQISISVQTAGITRTGFGKPLIAAYHTVYPEVVREYTDAGDMLTDGFLVGDAAYIIASQIMAQQPAPPSFLVGRLAETPNAMVETLTPTVVVGITYSVELADTDGVAATYEYTAVGGDTATDICDALRTAIGSNHDITASGTTTLVLTGDNIGEVFSLHAYTDTDPTTFLWARANSTADPGIATDLAAIKVVDDTWFGLCIDNPSTAIISSAATWCETNRKLLGFTTGDTDAATGALAGGDILDLRKTANQAFSYGLYSDQPHERGAEALMARIFPLDPGRATWAHKTLRSVSSVPMSATHRGLIESKNGNWYQTTAGKSITFPGKTGLDFIDVTRTVEWVKARMQEEIFLILTNEDKKPYTDKGIGSIEGAIRSVWDEGRGNGALNDDLTVTVPAAVDVSSADKLARLLSGVKFTGTVTGAIHTVQVQGTISA
jgi:hypothetical protein